nr:MAG TPA: SKIP/SNW domain [Caudoviricetes sp.]
MPWKVRTHQPERYLTKNELVKYRIDYNIPSCV